MQLSTRSMRNSTASPIRNKIIFSAALLLFFGSAVFGLFVGKYPITPAGLWAGDADMLWVFRHLRLSRTLTAALGGFALGCSGFVYQTVFRNPLASPDIIGVASGASAGAAAGILFFGGAAAVTACSFLGAVLAVLCALALSMADRTGKNGTIVLAGISVHALAQTVLMMLKLTADPEKELASIEYWMMGSLSDVSSFRIGWNLPLCVLCIGLLFLLHRQTMLLSTEEGEARMLGVPVQRMRLLVLLLATLVVSCVVSLTGLITFLGLLAPHAARLLLRSNRMETMALSGLLGGILLTGADILARSAAQTELPVSIFTSLLGAPFLVWLVLRGRRTE